MLFPRLLKRILAPFKQNIFRDGGIFVINTAFESSLLALLSSNRYPSSRPECASLSLVRKGKTVAPRARTTSAVEEVDNRPNQRSRRDRHFEGKEKGRSKRGEGERCVCGWVSGSGTESVLLMHVLAEMADGGDAARAHKNAFWLFCCCARQGAAGATAALDFRASERWVDTDAHASGFWSVLSSSMLRRYVAFARRSERLPRRVARSPLPPPPLQRPRSSSNSRLA